MSLSTLPSLHHDNYHLLSQWQEPCGDPRLTLFDLHRTPRPIQRDKHLRLPLEKLDFSCPICLGYMRKTSVIKECLHRFCDQCIQKCLRIGKKECPSCRIHIPSRRSLRADPKFDLLIHYMCGDLDVLEEMQMRDVEHYQELHKASSANRKRGMLHQATHRKALKSKSGSTITASGTATAAAAAAAAAAAVKLSNGPVLAIEVEPPTSPLATPPTFPLDPLLMEPSPLIEFELRKHPSEVRVQRLAREYIRLNGQATIHLLKGFLSQKLSHPNKADFVITIRLSSGVAALDDSLTLESVRNDLAEEAMMILQYRLIESQCEEDTRC